MTVELAKSIFVASLRHRTPPDDVEALWVLKDCSDPLPPDVCASHNLERGTTFADLIAYCVQVGSEKNDLFTAEAN